MPLAAASSPTLVVLFTGLDVRIGALNVLALQAVAMSEVRYVRPLIHRSFHASIWRKPISWIVAEVVDLLVAPGGRREGAIAAFASSGTCALLSACTRSRYRDPHRDAGWRARSSEPPSASMSTSTIERALALTFMDRCSLQAEGRGRREAPDGGQPLLSMPIHLCNTKLPRFSRRSAMERSHVSMPVSASKIGAMALISVLSLASAELATSSKVRGVPQGLSFPDRASLAR